MIAPLLPRDALAGKRFAGKNFDLEPEGELVLLGPYLAHRLAAVSSDHGFIYTGNKPLMPPDFDWPLAPSRVKWSVDVQGCVD